MADKKNQLLNKLRGQIDGLDEKIQSLISRRARLAQQVAEQKRKTGAPNFYRPEREAEVIRDALARNKGPLTDDDVERLFREIMSACLSVQSALKVAFLGPEGTFTQEAALKHFGNAVDTVSLSSIDEIFREVEAGSAQFGVVPIENSTEGVVNHTLDMFVGSSLRICGEIALRVHHNLLGKGADRMGATRVLAHQQSLAQCREWLDANLPRIARAPVASNAEAARQAAQDPATVAIAPAAAAGIYGLNVLAKNIEDRPNNTTRFLVIGSLDTEPTGHDKTSVLVSGRNRPGALYHLLAPLARHRINMTRIESRPSRQTLWEYVFFIDFEGHIKDRKVKKMLEALEKEAAMLKWLGSYPRAVT